MNKTYAKALFEKQTSALQQPRLLQSRSWRVNEISFPLLDVTFDEEGRNSLRVQLFCEHWNTVPPSAVLLTHEGTYVKSLPKGPSTVLNSSVLPHTRRPFICTQGILEYHQHPVHKNDLWEYYKGKPGFDLGSILTKIWHAWRATND